MKTKKQLFESGREYSRDEVINTLRAAGRKRARMFYNVFGWSVYYTTAPTFATPTGRAARCIGAAALLLLVRVLFMAVGLATGLAVMFGTALIISNVTPDSFAACLLLRVPLLFAAVGMWGFAWCWSLRHILPARLADYIEYGNR